MNLEDEFGRRFQYLRLSITDVCNFRCQYCLPNGYQAHSRQFLTVAEITRLVRGFAKLGMTKVRLVGGEPTVRKDFIEIATNLSSVEGIKTRAVTTNAYKLKLDAKAYYDAGLNHINISIDSLNPKTFTTITGHDK